jgi:AcrR family transcriptional regulator
MRQLYRITFIRECMLSTLVKPMPETADKRPPANGRRSQAERSAATREALLDAAIECLIEHGYSRTTTAMVAERAGLSRGAHLHHFQTRDALVAAGAEHLIEKRKDFLRTLEADLPAGRQGIERGLDLMFEGFSSPLYQVALDLWTDARTDEALRSQLVEVERSFDRLVLQSAAQLLPVDQEAEGFAEAVSLALAAMRGLALLDTLHPGRGRSARQWPACRGQLVSLFSAL